MTTRTSTTVVSRLLIGAGVLGVLLVGPRVATAQVPILVARWTFDASNGADASGDGHTLSVQGTASFAPARGGQAVSLDGAGGWLDRQYDPAFTPGTSSWSVCGWVNAPLDTASRHCLVSWYRCGANTFCGRADAPAYWLSLTPQGNADWYVRDDVDSVRDITSAMSISDGQWHFLVGVRDSAAEVVQLYVDGTLAGSLSLPPSSLSSGGLQIPLDVGRVFITGWSVPEQYLLGMIDDVRIYRGALTSSDVAALWGGGALAVAPAASPEVAFAPAQPNPFRSATTLRFTLPGSGRVRLAVYDVTGRRVRTLVEGFRAAGGQAVEWDGRDDAGAAAPAGLYLYRLETRLAGPTARVFATRGIRIP